MHCSELIERMRLNLPRNLFSGQGQDTWMVLIYRADKLELRALPGNCQLLEVFICDRSYFLL